MADKEEDDKVIEDEDSGADDGTDQPSEADDDDANDADDGDADDDDADDDDANDADDGDADDDDADDGDADDGDADDGDADDDDADDAGDGDADAEVNASPSTTKKRTKRASTAGRGDRGGPRSARKKRASKKGPRHPKKKKGSPTRNIVFFVALVGGLAAAFGVLGSRGGGATVDKPKWKTGQLVDLEITLVTPDHKNLGCAMKDAIDGLHCAFEAQNKKSSKSGDARTNANLLQPYTTTDRKQFMAAGLWTQPALKAKLDKENFDRPSPRFSVKCKLKVAGRSKNGSIQWKPGEAWFPANGWYAGRVQDCKIGK